MQRWIAMAWRILKPVCAAALLGALLTGCGGGAAPVVAPPPPPPPGPPPPVGTPFWTEWGQNPQHAGSVNVAGQAPNRMLASIVYDPFVSAEQAEEGGDLLTHYQAPLLAGDDVFMEFEGGTWIPCNPPGSGNPPSGQQACGPDGRNSKTWNERRLQLQNGQFTTIWNFQSDWKPEPDAGALFGWEPVFHAVMANGNIYVPGVGGTVYKLNAVDGTVVTQINPFGAVIDPNTFVAGPLSADAQGNVYYNALKLSDPSVQNPWTQSDALGAWLVKIAPDNTTSMVTFATLITNPPTVCTKSYSGTGTPLPWPPPSAAPAGACGSQRPGLNIAPAIAPDGTIYTLSRAHFNGRYGYLVAVNPNLTLKWAASLRDRLSDGCGGLVPFAPSAGSKVPNTCRFGATPGVDPQTGEMPAGQVNDVASSSPTVLPDGGIVYGALTTYNGARGHLFKFSAAGDFLAAYDFGWDTTPAVYARGGTYSILIKDNHYPAPLYCSPADDSGFCIATADGPYFITQLSPSLTPEWKFQSTNTQSCRRNADGSLSCVSDHPNGFEWCINAPVVDVNGVVYANSEDGNLYTINQGSGTIITPKQRLFLNLALGAAYTPLSISADGKIYTENDGSLFVVGN
jgi:outer membrane protein assembly factor BamB